MKEALVKQSYETLIDLLEDRRKKALENELPFDSPAYESAVNTVLAVMYMSAGEKSHFVEFVSLNTKYDLNVLSSTLEATGRYAGLAVLYEAKGNVSFRAKREGDEKYIHARTRTHTHTHTQKERKKKGAAVDPCGPMCELIRILVPAIPPTKPDRTSAPDLEETGPGRDQRRLWQVQLQFSQVCERCSQSRYDENACCPGGVSNPQRGFGRGHCAQHHRLDSGCKPPESSSTVICAF